MKGILKRIKNRHAFVNQLFIKMNLNRYYIFLTIIILSLVFISCGQNGTPLPRGYFRIELPEKEYQQFDTTFPYSFSYPVYGEVIPDQRADAEPWWADVVFPSFRASLHLSYKTIDEPEQLYDYIEDGRNFVNRHIPKATGFQENLYSNEETNVYGILYEIRGREAASPMQFYLTDSTKHYLRGSLYFNVTPNNDSLAPVIRFLADDIRILMETLEWK